MDFVCDSKWNCDCDGDCDGDCDWVKVGRAKYCQFYWSGDGFGGSARGLVGFCWWIGPCCGGDGAGLIDYLVLARKAARTSQSGKLPDSGWHGTVTQGTSSVLIRIWWSALGEWRSKWVDDITV